MVKSTLVQCACNLVFCLALVLANQGPLSAGIVEGPTGTWTWSGQPIAGEDDPTFFPSGSAVFWVSDHTLTLTLTYIDSNKTLQKQDQVLAGLLWEINDDPLDPVTLTPEDAVVTSVLVRVDDALPDIVLFTETDMTGEWGFMDDIDAGSLGSGFFGVGEVGSVNFDADAGWGPQDTFDFLLNGNNDANLSGPPAPDGANYGIVPDDTNLASSSLSGQGPFVQDAILFTFAINSHLDLNMITNVQPLFGTSGAPLVPEPASLLLLGTGITGLLGRRFFRRR